MGMEFYTEEKLKGLMFPAQGSAAAVAAAVAAAAAVEITPLEGALRMAALGVKVAPIAARKKFPPIEDFPNLATVEGAQINKWAGERPNCNWLALATTDTVCFIDEDQSDVLHALYQEKFNQPFPVTRTSESQPNHKQSCWLQTDRTRAFGNRIQGDFKDGMLSFRQRNEYCLVEGSIHPITGKPYLSNGAPIISMPDTVMELLESLVVVRKKVDASPNGEKIPYHQHDDELTRIAGSLRRAGMEEQTMAAALIEICEKRCEGYGEDYVQMCEKIAHSICKKAVGKDERVMFSSASGTANSAGGELGIEEVRELIHLLVYSNAKERAASEKGLPTNPKEAVNMASRLVYENLKTKGKFFNADGVGYLLLNDDRLVKVAPDDAHFSRLFMDYGIYPGQDEFAKLGKFMGMMAATEGTRATIRYSAHYNKETQCFYFAESNSLIRGNGTTLERVPNGTDGELFVLNPEVPFSIPLDVPLVKNSLIAEPSSLLNQLLFNDLVFKNSSLSDEGKKILLTTYIMLLILGGIANDRPMLQMIGPTGCGKTFFLKKLGRAIAGLLFNVQSLPEEPREFENVLMNNDLAFFDNVDSVNPKIRSLVCQAVTGFQIVRRELFTTSGESKTPSKATLGISSLTPVLPTSEQANRSVAIHLLARAEGTNMDESTLMEDFDSQRGQLIAEILARASMVLKALNAQKDYKPRVKSRLAGFASIILKVARHEGWEAGARDILESWEGEQHEGALDNDDLSAAIYKWMSNPQWVPVTLHASELNTALRVHSDGTDSSWKCNPRALSVMLAKSETSYQKRFGLVIGKDSRTHGSTFEFHPPEGLLVMLQPPREGAEAVVDLEQRQ